MLRDLPFLRIFLHRHLFAHWYIRLTLCKSWKNKCMQYFCWYVSFCTVCSDVGVWLLSVFQERFFFSNLYVWFDPLRGGKDPFKHLKFLRFWTKIPIFSFSLSVMLITLFLETDHWAQTWQGLGDDNDHDDTYNHRHHHHYYDHHHHDHQHHFDNHHHHHHHHDHNYCHQMESQWSSFTCMLQTAGKCFTILRGVHKYLWYWDVITPIEFKYS